MGAKNKFIISLEERGSLALLVATDLEVLAPLKLQRIRYPKHKIKKKYEETTTKLRQKYLDWVLRVVLAALALQLQHNLLCCLGLKCTSAY